MNILSLLGGGILGQVGDFFKIFLGSKSERDAAIAEEVKAVQSAYMTELNAAEKVGWWPSLIDGINRLVRPFFTFGAVALLIWPVLDPVQFQIAMSAASTIPEQLWYLVYTVVGFWFGGRLLERAPTRVKALTATEVSALLLAQKKLAELNNPAPTSTPTITEEVPAVEEPISPPKPVAVPPKKKPWEGRNDR